MTAKALQVIIKSGKPTGIKMVRVSGWDGVCYMIPRQALAELSEDSDVNAPGLYFLFGRDESNYEQLVYIGESEHFLKRITSHNASKDFWDEAVVFTGDLNKAHVKYLESKAVELAKSANRMKLQNNVAPAENRLSEFDKVTVNLFFDNAKFILETFTYDVFKSIKESVKKGDRYFLSGSGFEATARLLDSGGMIVSAGSLASIRENKSFGGWAKAARQKFLETGELIEEGEYYRLTTDVAFRSPSGAAATFAARSINGWTAWRDDKDKTLDENVRRD